MANSRETTPHELLVEKLVEARAEALHVLRLGVVKVDESLWSEAAHAG
ncbi:MAG: hypothetical protein ACLFU2_04830 [Opitutales bacterium]